MFVISCYSKASAELVILVLASQGIDVDIEVKGGEYLLSMESLHRERALRVLDDFLQEQPEKKTSCTPIPEPANRGGIIFIVLVLCAVHGGAVYFDVHAAMVGAYGASALYIQQGEYFRTFTALMLHADVGHLFGNIAGILVLGVPVCSISGTWQGMLLILGSGALGNFINAHLFRAARLSIGASTAVMGAAGILVAFQLSKAFLKLSFRPAVFFPLGAGLALVGMLSGGENTDVSAHVFGFFSGLFAGGLFELIQTRFSGKSAWFL